MHLVCPICPKACRLENLEIGECQARQNVAGKIIALAYAKPCSISVDPMEKKPLFHFYPGTGILSLGMAGCNLHCKNCQNYTISQANPQKITFNNLRPEQLVALMQQTQVKSVAYTYTEPLVAFEYVLDCAKQVAKSGGYNVLVTAAYINKQPLQKLLPYIHAANVDLKSMDEEFYQQQCQAKLQPVLQALQIMREAGICLEVTNLLIPGFNDSSDAVKKLVDFVVTTLGVETPLHFSRFFPTYLQQDLPPTPEASLYQAKQIAMSAGLKHVYLGNLRDTEEITYCVKCTKALIRRSGYTVTSNLLIDATCPDCKTPLYGRFYAAT